MDPQTKTRAGIAMLVYMMVNATIFGAGLILALTLPAFQPYAKITIPIVVVGSLILAAPVAWWLAPRLRARNWHKSPERRSL